MLLINEAFVMLNIYVQITFTDINRDPEAKVVMGNVLIAITVLNMAVNIGRILL